MDKRIEMLKAWDCDVAGAMPRMLDDEEFYMECLNDIPGDKNFEGLIEALKGEDVSAGFDCAHTLKGLLANLGLTPMCNKVVEIVEPLRKGKNEGASVNYAALLEKGGELLEMRDRLTQILAE